ncbi:hypothetical protein LTR28_011634 [Elasticomyces elasticus]|nr:hypothetical protein LTR28_011634 [Elasticomyces elasticus]
MHVVQTLTAIHDRYLSAPFSTTQTATEIYHWGQAAALFNEKLSAPIRPCDRDALWATAALLGAITFSSTEASKPEESWPLRPSSSSDLEWLRMSDGKKAIWRITDPLRKDSVFHKLADETEQDYLSSIAPNPGHGVIVSAFTALCDLDDSPTSGTNPYFAAVHSLAPLLDIEKILAQYSCLRTGMPSSADLNGGSHVGQFWSAKQLAFT